MGYCNGGSARNKLLQRVLNVFFRLRIKGACRLVENKYARVVQKRPCNGDPLPLSAGERIALFADYGIVPIAEPHGKFVHARKLCGVYDLSGARPRLCICDILIQRSAEQHGLLKHNSHMMPQGFLFYIPYVNTAYAYRSFVGVVQTHYEIYKRRFADTRAAYYAYHLAGADRKVYVFQHLCGAVVSEAYVVYFNFSVGIGIHRAGHVRNIAFLVDNVKNLCNRRHGIAQPPRKSRHPAQRAVYHGYIDGKLLHFSESHCAVKNFVSHKIQKEKLSESHKKACNRPCKRKKRFIGSLCFALFRYGAVVTLFLILLRAEGFYHTYARKSIVQNGACT